MLIAGRARKKRKACTKKKKQYARMRKLQQENEVNEHSTRPLREKQGTGGNPEDR